jgi:hypothetical protein
MGITSFCQACEEVDQSRISHSYLNDDPREFSMKLHRAILDIKLTITQNPSSSSLYYHWFGEGYHELSWVENFIFSNNYTNKELVNKLNDKFYLIQFLLSQAKKKYSYEDKKRNYVDDFMLLNQIKRYSIQLQKQFFKQQKSKDYNFFWFENTVQNLLEKNETLRNQQLANERKFEEMILFTIQLFFLKFENLKIRKGINLKQMISRSVFVLAGLIMFAYNSNYVKLAIDNLIKLYEDYSLIDPALIDIDFLKLVLHLCIIYCPEELVISIRKLFNENIRGSMLFLLVSAEKDIPGLGKLISSLMLQVIHRKKFIFEKLDCHL